MLFQRLLQALNTLHSQQGKLETQSHKDFNFSGTGSFSSWESDIGTLASKSGGWQQPLSQSSCLASCRASCEANKSWTAGCKCLKTEKNSRQNGEKHIDVDIHWTNHVKYSAKKHPCFQVSIYPPCAWAPLMRHRHRDECHRLYRLSFTGWYRALLATDAKQPNQWKEKAGPFWLCLATTSNHESLVSLCCDLQDEKIIVFWKDWML